MGDLKCMEVKLDFAKGVGPETHVHKITNVPVFYMALGLYDFDAGKSITQAIGRVGP